jgi:predicted aspartyl protease
MTIRRAVAAAGVAAGLFCASPASAACTIKGALPIAVTMEGPRAVVSLKINGQEGRFFIDSGSAFNGITSKFAAELKLKPITNGGNEGERRINDAAGAETTGVAGNQVRNGWVVAPEVEFIGATFKNLAFLATDKLSDKDGIIGQPLLKQADVEYDLKGGVIRLVKPDGCKDTDITYWAKEGAAYSKIPLDTSNQRDRPMTKSIVYVNGVRMRATFDTGAPTTFITDKAAARAGVRTTDPGVAPVAQASGLDGKINAWVGVFKSVKVGDEEIQNGPLEIGASDADFDMLIGADFFMSHHVYVANSQDRLYFSYEGGPVFRARKTGPATAAAVQTPSGAAGCALQVPPAPAELGPGTVTTLMTAAMVKANIEGGQAQLHGLMDPAYADRTAVVVHLDSGRDQVGRAPPGLDVHVGDRVTLQGVYRNAALPCHYIPNLVTADQGQPKPTP